MFLSYPDPTLTDAKVTLRPWLDSDLTCVEEASTHPDIRPLTFLPRVYTSAEGLAFIDRQRARFTMEERLAFAIVEAWSNEAVGHIELVGQSQRGVVDIRYWLLKRRRGNRLGFHAVQLLSRWALEEAGVSCIEAQVEASNIAAVRVLNKAGFQLERVLRLHNTAGKREVDASLYLHLPYHIL